MNEVKVRTAVPQDFAAAMDLLVQANAENGLARMDVNKLVQIVGPALHCSNGIIGAIGPVGGPLEGVVLLQIEKLWYSEEPIIAEKLVYVHPDFRSAKGGRAAKLCEFAKRVSDEMGIPLVVGVLSNERTKGKIRTYERLLGPQAGAYFLYNGQTGLSHNG